MLEGFVFFIFWGFLFIVVGGMFLKLIFTFLWKIKGCLFIFFLLTFIWFFFYGCRHIFV